MATFLVVLSWVITAVALLGSILNAQQNKWGFVLWFISNIYLCLWNYFWTKDYAQGTLFLAYFIITVQGFVTWSKKEKARKLQEEQAL